MSQIEHEYTPDDWQYWAYLGGGAAVLREHQRIVREVRLRALQEAHEAVRGEIIAVSDCDDDDNYNCGIADATAAIDALIDKEASK